MATETIRISERPAWALSDEEVSWRMEVLSGASVAGGAEYPVELTERLARDRSLDVHYVVGLVHSGCPPMIAANLGASEPVPWETETNETGTRSDPTPETETGTPDYGDIPW